MVGFMDYHALGKHVPSNSLHMLMLTRVFSGYWYALVMHLQGCLNANPPSVNTFTEHRGHGWSVKDMQHT